jgi:hypothetical protein
LTPEPPFAAALDLAAVLGLAFFGVRASRIALVGDPRTPFSAALGAAALGSFSERERAVDRAVVDFVASRGACEMMITVVITLDPSKDLSGSILELELELELIHIQIQYQ